MIALLRLGFYLQITPPFFPVKKSNCHHHWIFNFSISALMADFCAMILSHNWN